jgi:hypothetical protein
MVNHREHARYNFVGAVGLGRVRSQGRKGCQRIIRIKGGPIVLGVPFGARSAHIMEFRPVGDRRGFWPDP